MPLLVRIGAKLDAGPEKATFTRAHCQPQLRRLTKPHPRDNPDMSSSAYQGPRYYDHTLLLDDIQNLEMMLAAVIPMRPGA